MASGRAKEGPARASHRQQRDPVALGKWVRRQSHNTVPVAQKGVSFQGSHRAWLPAQPTLVQHQWPAQPLDARDQPQLGSRAQWNGCLNTRDSGPRH